MWYALSKIGRDLEERRKRRQEEAAGNFVTAIRAVGSGPERRSIVQAIVQAAEDEGIPGDALAAAARKAGVVLPGERRRSRRRRRFPPPTDE